MTTIDWGVILLYFIGLLGIGVIFSRRAGTASGMFVAARQSPWWLSGISAYMTMFSAGTFVVWGGITYEYGMVGIAICCMYGISAFIAGRFFAGKWNKTGLSTGAEFVEARYGKGAFHFYTWYRLIFLFNSGLALYGLAVMICPLLPLSEGHILADPATGMLSVPMACVILAVIVIAYTMIGGLWAVLVTDTLQFFVLTTCLALVVPLLIILNGGFGPIIAAAPEGFFKPVAPGFSAGFLVGWMLLNMFTLGADWSFIQRHLCVPTAKDAQKALYLFGGLYLVTPFLWMAPPLIFRTMEAGANPEQAYILAVEKVLPIGMLGLMIAAMFSATASSISTQLNVFAGVLTDDIYCRHFRPQAKDKELVLAGRIFTVLIGLYMLGGALILPRVTTYRNFVIVMASILGPAVSLPTLFGLFCRKISRHVVWLVILVGGGLGVLNKIGFAQNGFLTRVAALEGTTEFVQQYTREVDIFFGIGVVAIIMVIAQLTGRERPEWENLQQTIRRKKALHTIIEKPSVFPALVMGYCVAGLGLVILCLVPFNDRDQFALATTSFILFLFGAFFIFYVGREARPKEMMIRAPSGEKMGVKKEQG
jgi:Na+/proline symporter